MLKRMLLTFVSVTLLGIFITSGISTYMMHGNYKNSLEEKLISNAALIAALVAEMAIEKIDPAMDALAQSIQSRITIIDDNGVVIGDSAVELNAMQNHSDRSEIIDAMKTGIGQSVRYSKSTKTDMLYVAIKSTRENKPTVVRLAVPLKAIQSFNTLLFEQASISVILGLAISLLVGYRFSMRIVTPLQALTQASRRISEGAYGERVYFNSKDEVGELAQTFNLMSKALFDNVQNFNDRNMKLSAILNSMINAVIVVDNHRKILFTNPEAEKVFGFRGKSIEGHYFIEVLRHNILDEQIRNLIVDGKEVVTDIEIFEPQYCILKVYSNPIELQSDDIQRYGVVMLFQDITEMRKLERMRKDFVANVSHELKTPLTSIKGFVETLRGGAIENVSVRERFLQIIEIETDRLTTIIDDLLKLSDIENDGMRMMTETFDVCQPTIEVLEFLKDLADKKDIHIAHKIPGEPLLIQGKLIWYKQLLINLVDNAIKYNQNNGTVEVELKEVGALLIISVTDTGPGIDEEHLDRLFERFYRVDKARSRDIGGTGLGLSIVKHIVLHFEGKINVSSQIGKGTQFVVELPLVK
jgi:two-component system phosphate regulon sensor histidine kinase PhoR